MTKIINRNNQTKACGLTLIECLLAASLMLLIIMATVELSRGFRRLFFSLKKSQEFYQEIWAGQDKLRRDLAKAGYGLEACLAYGLIMSLESKDNGLAIYSREATFPLKPDIASGSTVIPISHNNSISRGQLGAIIDDKKGELFRVNKVEKEKIYLSQPLKESYLAGSLVLVIEEIFYYLDRNNQILRRRVNSSSGQPLLENVTEFNWLIGNEGKVQITLLFKLEVGGKREILNEIKIFPKNAVLHQTKLF
ncbi:MAG: hypothetical protein N3B16_03935 [Candidatus Aminicenantes bacterium]|nr:hypothetical protein [Candidatus Aminicenantes bacterium]